MNMNENQDFSKKPVNLPQACSAVSRMNNQSPIRYSNYVVDQMKEKLSFFTGTSLSCDQTYPDMQPRGEQDLSSNMWQFPSSTTHTKVPDQSISFSNILSVSDLERDELLCKQSWSYLPLEKFNLSVTAVDNSKINPPNFMPVEDSLFQELNPGHSDTLMSTALSSLKNLAIEDKPFNKNTDSKPSPNKIQSLSPERDQADYSFNVPSIKDISLALRSCDEGASPLTLMDEVLRAGEKPVKFHKKPECLPLPQKGLSSCLDDTSVTYEDVLIWGSVELGDSVVRTVHILNSSHCVNKVVIDGSSCYMLTGGVREAEVSQSMHIPFYKLGIIFNPVIVGPALATMTISSATEVLKEIPLSGFGGKSNLVLNNIGINDVGVKLILINNLELRGTFTLHNFGTAPAFFHIALGTMEDYLYTKQLCGVINANSKRIIDINIRREKKVLKNILSFFHGNAAHIGKITICFGDEATRQRIKKLCKYFQSQNRVTTVENHFPQLLEDFSEIPFNLANIADTYLQNAKKTTKLPKRKCETSFTREIGRIFLKRMCRYEESIPHLLQEGVQQTDVNVAVQLSCIYEYLHNVNNCSKRSSE